jgi:putative membrane protein
MKFLIRWLISAIALFVAINVVPGIEVQGNAYVVVVITALIMGFLNAILRPILTVLSCGFIVLTLGLFMFVINAVVLWLSAYIAQMFGVGFYVDGFMPALMGSIVISLISLVLSVILKDE